MARYNEILVGRFNRGVQKLFGMKGGPPAPQLSSEIQVNHQLFSGTENRYLEGWSRFGQDTAPITQAAAKSGLRLRNAPTSGVVIVIEKLLVSQWTAADTPFMQLGGGNVADLDFLVVVTSSRFDPRGAPSPTGILSITNAAGIVATLGTKLAWNQALLANVELITTDLQEIPLLPGDTWQISGNTNNTTGHIGIWWRERIIEDSERT
jgi:hypothetical protein